MGLFSRFRKKKKQEPVVTEPLFRPRERTGGSKQEGANQIPPLESVDVHNKEERDEYIKTCCQWMVDADKELEAQKKEYQKVNDCLADIQEISNLPEDISNNIFVLAQEISSLMNSRKQFQESGRNRLQDEKYLKFRQFEEDMPKTLRKLEESEQYLAEIKSDLQQLEGEKAVIIFQKKSLSKERGNLRGLCYILVITLIICVLALFAMKSIFEMDIQAGYYLSIFIAAVVAAYIFIRNNRNIKEKKIAEKQMSKVITLLNKVKIKYVNTNNTIEYLYKKYGVNSSHELRFEWEQYQEMRRSQEEFSRFGVDLAFAQENLAKMLKEYPLRNPDLWVRRADILVDNERLTKEITALENQRAIIQKNMEYNVNNRQESRQSIEEMVKEYPQYSQEILEMVEGVDRNSEVV